MCVCLSRICVWEWWQRQTICLAESGCAWYPLCLGVAALQMFWLFLALLCFWFPLVCLELEGLQAVHSGTFEEVLVKTPCCVLSIKLLVPFHLYWDHSNIEEAWVSSLFLWYLWTQAGTCWTVLILFNFQFNVPVRSALHHTCSFSMVWVKIHDLFSAAYIVYVPGLVVVILAVFLSNNIINKICM